MKRRDMVTRISLHGAALAFVLPLALITVTGCSTVRSCGSARSDSDGNSAQNERTATVLQDSAPRAGGDVPSEGKFLGKVDGDIEGTRVTVRGRVMMYGNAPHETSAFTLEDGSGSLAFYPDSREREARALQGKLVELEAILLDPSVPHAGTRDAFQPSGTIEPLSWKIVN